MYGLDFLNKSDSRKLLLDYSKIESPMLKDFSSEGVKDVFYDILDNQVTILNADTVEL
jgi:NADH:ubiquinone oxidoreductase subunit C